MSDEAPSGRERRGSVRHLACVPIYIQSEDNEKKRTSVIRELSVSGAQVLTNVTFEVDARVQLSLFIRDPEVPVTASGKVIRKERRTDGGIWRYKIVVQFDEALKDLEPEIEALAEHQKSIAKSEPPPSK